TTTGESTGCGSHAEGVGHEYGGSCASDFFNCWGHQAKSSSSLRQAPRNDRERGNVMLAGVKTDCKVVDAELDRQFAGRGSQLSLDAQRHLDECERCRTLYSYLAEEFPVAA